MRKLKGAVGAAVALLLAGAFSAEAAFPAEKYYDPSFVRRTM
ncbi:MAG: hypothetical protein AABZ64_01785 [Nitrospinota bacterium]